MLFFNSTFIIKEFWRNKSSFSYPISQSVQVADPGFYEYLPFSHGIHSNAPSDEYFPAGQFWQFAKRVDSTNVLKVLFNK